jgi:hypothetical protein
MVKNIIYKKMAEDLNEIPPTKQNKWEEVKINVVLPKITEEKKINLKRENDPEGKNGNRY